MSLPSFLLFNVKIINLELFRGFILLDLNVTLKVIKAFANHILSNLFVSYIYFLSKSQPYSLIKAYVVVFVIYQVELMCCGFHTVQFS